MEALALLIHCHTSSNSTPQCLQKSKWPPRASKWPTGSGKVFGCFNQPSPNKFFHFYEKNRQRRAKGKCKTRIGRRPNELNASNPNLKIKLKLKLGNEKMSV